MSYFEQTKSASEVKVHETQLHPLRTYLFTISLSLLGVFSLFTPEGRVMSIFWFLIAGLIFLKDYLIVKNSEFIISNERIVLKTELISTKSSDMKIEKVENLSVKQGLIGKIFNYGTILVGGSGGSKNVYKNVRDPFNFIKQFNELK